jgi:hypothetical protein
LNDYKEISRKLKEETPRRKRESTGLKTGDYWIEQRLASEGGP